MKVMLGRMEESVQYEAPSLLASASVTQPKALIVWGE